MTKKEIKAKANKLAKTLEKTLSDLEDAVGLLDDAIHTLQELGER